MATALAECLSAVREMQTQRQAAYRQLVALLAGDDVEVDPTEVVEVVTAAGKSMDDLDADTRRLSARMVARATLDLLPERERKRAAAEIELDRVTTRADQDLARVLADLESKRKAAVAARNAAVEAARRPVEEAAALVVESQGARFVLIESADSTLRHRLADLRHRRAAAVSALAARSPEVRGRLAEIDRLLVGGVPEPRDESRRPYPPGVEGERLRQAEQRTIRARRIQVENLTSEKSQLLAEIAALESWPPHYAAEIAAVEQEMLDV